MKKIIAGVIFVFVLLLLSSTNNINAQTEISCNESTFGKIGPAGGCGEEQICKRGSLGGYTCSAAPFCALSANVVENNISFNLNSCGSNPPNMTVTYQIIIYDGGDPIFTVDPNVGVYTMHNPGTYTARLRQRIFVEGSQTVDRLGPTININIDDEDSDEDIEIPVEPVAKEITLCRTSSGTNGVPTAIGCIDVADTNLQSATVLTIGVGVSGGIALLLMAISAFKIMTSANNPRQLQSGNELFLSALTGLGVIILSALILRFFGSQLLGLF